MVTRRLGWAAMVAVAGALACAPRRTSNLSGLAGSEAAPTVTVRNDNWLDVAIYVIRGASRFRIGTVSSTTSMTFRLPREGLGDSSPLQIMADPIGENRQYLTDPVVLSPGQRLEVTVGSPLSISSFAVWNR